MQAFQVQTKIIEFGWQPHCLLLSSLLRFILFREGNVRSSISAVYFDVFTVCLSIWAPNKMCNFIGRNAMEVNTISPTQPETSNIDELGL